MCQHGDEEQVAPRSVLDSSIDARVAYWIGAPAGRALDSGIVNASVAVCS